MFASLASFRALRLSAAVTPWMHFEDDLRAMGLFDWEEPLIRRALLADLATGSREELDYFTNMLAEYSEIASRLLPLPPLPPSPPLPQLPPTPPMAPIDALPRDPHRPASAVPFSLSETETEPDSDSDTAASERGEFVAIEDEEAASESAEIKVEAAASESAEETKDEAAAEPSLKRGRDDDDDEESESEPPKRVRYETRSSKRSGSG
jgi:hypothetical protein